MRFIQDRDTPLEFGAHGDKTLAELADEQPSYFAWLWRENIVNVVDGGDQDWFEETGQELDDSDEVGCEGDEEY